MSRGLSGRLNGGWRAALLRAGWPRRAYLRAAASDPRPGEKAAQIGQVFHPAIVPALARAIIQHFSLPACLLAVEAIRGISSV